VLKDLRSGEQETLPLDRLAEAIHEHLAVR
jgi:hypothetical protein